MSEQRHPLYNKLRAAGLAVVAVGALAVGACTSGEAPKDDSKQVAVHLPGDDFPTIESAAGTAPIQEYGNIIDMSKVSQTYDPTSYNHDKNAPEFVSYQNIHPVTNKRGDV